MVSGMFGLVDVPNLPVVIGGWIGIFGGGGMIVLLAWQSRQPRLAFEPGHLLVYLRSGRPYRVPIEIVECLFLGQAPSRLPSKRHESTKTATVVVRLAERAESWRERDVKPALGSWRDGYITILGTWCEPLDRDLVNRLNQRLAEVRR